MALRIEVSSKLPAQIPHHVGLAWQFARAIFSRRATATSFMPLPLGIDREANPHVGAWVPIRRDAHGSTDTPRLDRHIETRSTFSDPDRNSYHRRSIPSLTYLLLPSGGYLSRLRTPLKAEPTPPSLKGVLRSPFPCLASERLCASLIASSRRCLLQELGSYIGSMLFFSFETAGAPTVRVRTPAYKRGRLHSKRLLLPTNGFGAAAWPQQARTPPVRPELRPTPGDTQDTPPVLGSRPPAAAEAELPPPP